MSETAETTDESGVSDAYKRAGTLNAKLASGYDAALASEAKQLSDALFAHVQSKVADYDEFVRQVERSETFSLHDSAQVNKKERGLKIYYLRAISLVEGIKEAEARRR